MGSEPLVLIVEDEALIADVLERYLRADGFRTRIVGDVPSAVENARAMVPDLVLLDIGLPGGDGYEVLAAIRRMGDLPVVFVTARVEDLDRLVGFRLGADDYVTKPFNPSEVVARVRAVLRRTHGATSPRVLRYGNVEIDLIAQSVSVTGLRVGLTVSEFRLLAQLAEQPRRVFTRAQLLALLEDSVGSERVVDAHVGTIRRKLAAAGGDSIIETVRGVGYRLWPPA